MPYRDSSKGQWDIPLGPVGIGAMAIVGAVAFTLGQFNFYGLEFLAYLHLMGAWVLGVAVFAAASGTLLECIIWNGRLGDSRRLLRSWPSGRRAMLATGLLVMLAGAWLLAHQQYQCLLFTAPVVFLIVFALVGGTLQEPILFHLRGVGRPLAAFAALLALEAGIIFLIGEWMAMGEYRKGLTRFQNENRAEWSISASGGGAEFYFDYARQETVLRTHTIAGDPVEVRRPFVKICS
jgi:hypothetical protein